MRRKRLKHAADTLCRMFCGWRLTNSFQQLEGLGSGTLKIDVLTGVSDFNDLPVGGLSIAGELHAWFQQDLKTHRIPVSGITSATLVAELNLNSIDSEGRSINAFHFDQSGRSRSDGEFLRLDIACEALVATDESTYQAQHRDREEWPRVWPAA